MSTMPVTVSTATTTPVSASRTPADRVAVLRPGMAADNRPGGGWGPLCRPIDVHLLVIVRSRAAPTLDRRGGPAATRLRPNPRLAWGPST